MCMLNIIVYIFMCSDALINSCFVDFMKGKYLHGWTFKEIKKSSLYSCAADCVSYPICKSFNLDMESRICRLNINTHVQFPNDLKTDEKYVYSETSVWNEISLGPCQNSTCGITQRCVVSRKETIHCEDVVTNVATDRPATSSSVYARSNIPFTPKSAVDGKSDVVWNSGSCFAVASGDNHPWWQVDLMDFYAILSVHITNRGDCCADRLHDFAIEVYKEDPVSQADAELQLCYMYNGAGIQAGVTVNMTCTTPLIGRYVRVKGDIPKSEYDVLQFCEVQVIAIYWPMDDEMV